MKQVLLIQMIWREKWIAIKLLNYDEKNIRQGYENMKFYKGYIFQINDSRSKYKREKLSS